MKAGGEIETIEERLTFLDNEMTKEEIYTSVSKCMEISREQDSLKERLNMLYESWEDLASHMS